MEKEKGFYFLETVYLKNQYDQIDLEKADERTLMASSYHPRNE